MDSTEPSAKKSRKSSLKTFQSQWYDDFSEWKSWVKECPSDSNKFFCIACNENLACGRSEIDRHSKTQKHLGNLPFLSLRNNLSGLNFELSGIETASSSSYQPEASSSSPELTFNERIKAAEIRFATFLAQHNISLRTAPKLLDLFQEIGKEPAVLQGMVMGKTKTTAVINKVVCVRESNRIVKVVRATKFSIFVDESTDITNDKWMTLMIRYVDPETLIINTELLKLIHLDATNGSADKLTKEFTGALAEKEVLPEQIISLACDNASVMVGSKTSFKVRMTQKLPKLLTLPCICHSLALAAKEACSAIPAEIHTFVANISSFINNSPKRLAIFTDFQKCYYDHPRKITRFAATRWLSRQVAITRILDNWQALNGFLIDQSSEKSATADELLNIIQKPMTKAYLFFLQCVLDSFNKINAHFQGNDTLVHQLQPNSKKLLTEILQRFMKPALLKPEIFDSGARKMNFGLITNHRDLSEVDFGSDCNNYLLIQQRSGVPESIINQLRSDCLNFYVKAAEQLRDRLPFDDKFLSDLTVFAQGPALIDRDRESSFSQVKNTCDKLNVPGDRRIQEEWRSLYCIDPNLKEQWCKLPFDDMWMKICTTTHSDGTLQFPTLRLLVSLIRSLPHSNAAAERAFSLIPEIKTKKRNGLSPKTLNSLCVIRSVSKSGNLIASSMTIDQSYVEMMNASNLYPKEEKKIPESKLNVYAYVSSEGWVQSE